MNGEKNESYALDADSLRETLGYSMRFQGKLFCIVIDAECFDEFRRDRMVSDLILMSRSCDIKLFIILGCFPSRMRGKRLKMAKSIASATKELKKLLGESAKVIELVGSLDSFPSRLNSILGRHQIVIVPSMDYEESEAPAALEVKRILSSLSGFTGREQISKLVIISRLDGIFDENRQLYSQIDSSQLRDLISRKLVTGEFVSIAETALSALQKGIKRVHIVNGKRYGGLLVELFTKDGSGTMIYSGPYIEVRQALPEDIGDLQSLMSRYANQDALRSCSEENAGQFLLAAIDEYVVACARLRVCEKKFLISSLVVNPDYPEIGLELLSKATQNENRPAVLAVHRPVPWWIPADFREADAVQLPQEILAEYDGKKQVVFLSKDVS